ncbi:MAG: molybdopterin cofactor-binding domain-containing protein [bacterium]
MKYVGKPTVRLDGRELVKGRAVFTDDMTLPDMLHLKVLRSPHAHALVKKIDTSRAKALPGVVAVYTHEDFAPHFYTTAGQGFPEPSPRDVRILEQHLRHVGDRVALVAAETVEIAEEALELIVVEYEILPANFDPQKAMEFELPLHPEEETVGIHDPKRNIAAHIDASVGDVEKGLKESAQIFEGTYSTPYVQQAHIEPHITLSWLDERDRIVIRTATQVPFHVRRIVAEVLGLPVGRIRVIKPRIGGGFGAKQEILGEELCAAVTLKTGRPARLQMTRAEELYAARSRHPQIVHFRIGVNEDATFNAIDMNILENTGAYGAHALTVMSVTAQKSLTLYRSPNVRVVGDAVYTNLFVAGAYRGYGSPQGFFGLEILVDEIADKLGIDPIELRRRNHRHIGDEVPIAKVLGEGREGFPVVLASEGLDECLEIGRREIDWDRLRVEEKEGVVKRGVGVAATAQGSGIAGVDMGAVFIKMNEDGSFNLHAGATDLGTGSDTALAQIAAEVLEVPVEKFIVYSSDTDITPFDTGAYASSTTYISGGAVKKAAEEVKRQILEQGKRLLGVEDAEVSDGKVVAKDGSSVTFEEICTKSMYTDNQIQIMGSASHMSYDSPVPFNATFADVSVDTETGLVRVNKIVSVTEAGQVVNPPMAEGQAEGAVPQSLGMALTEHMAFDENGAPVNLDFNQYHIYAAPDMPEIVAKFIDSNEPSGPFGAKAVGEIPINAPAPAVINAIYNACGVRLHHSPVSPEEILRQLSGRK